MVPKPLRLVTENPCGLSTVPPFFDKAAALNKFSTYYIYSGTVDNRAASIQWVVGGRLTQIAFYRSTANVVVVVQAKL